MLDRIFWWFFLGINCEWDYDLCTSILKFSVKKKVSYSVEKCYHIHLILIFYELFL